MKIKKHKKNARKNMFPIIETNICINCGKLGTHYVMPCMGEDGFFICDKKSENTLDELNNLR